MKLLLEGQTAFVTGAGGGIGRATALAFAEEGARVMVTDINVEGAAETAAMIIAAGGGLAAGVGQLAAFYRPPN